MVDDKSHLPHETLEGLLLQSFQVSRTLKEKKKTGDLRPSSYSKLKARS